MILKRIAFLILSLTFGLAQAQQYNRFGPANGVLKGATTSPQTTAAASSDILALWSGTCSASTFLRGDGACAAAGGGSSPLTTKGDLFGFTTADARVPVGTNGNVLTADSTASAGVSWQPAGGGGGSPGGSSTDIQYNSSGSFAGDSGLTWNSTAGTMTLIESGNTVPALIVGTSQGYLAAMQDSSNNQWFNIAYNGGTFLMGVSIGSKTSTPADGGLILTGDGGGGTSTAELAAGDRFGGHHGISIDQNGAVKVNATPGSPGQFLTSGGGSAATGWTGLTTVTSSSIGGSPLVAGACASVAVGFSTTTFKTAIASPDTYPGDGFYWSITIDSTTNATVRVCAAVAGTPTASTYNVRLFP